MRTVFRAGLAAALGLVATTSHAAQTVAQDACLTQAEATALFLTVAPTILKSVSGKCIKVLPESAYLRINGEALIARYAGPSAAAKPAAIAAFNKISGEAKLDESMFEMMTGEILGEIVAGDVKPDECMKFDRIAGLLDPMPPENIAGLLIAFVEFADEKGGDKEKKKAGPFSICKAA
ncbi:MAG: hypothetical protein V4808_14720 [Pseudomonadota bacterium]